MKLSTLAASLAISAAPACAFAQANPLTTVVEKILLGTPPCGSGAVCRLPVTMVESSTYAGPPPAGFPAGPPQTPTVLYCAVTMTATSTSQILQSGLNGTGPLYRNNSTPPFAPPSATCTVAFNFANSTMTFMTSQVPFAVSFGVQSINGQLVGSPAGSSTPSVLILFGTPLIAGSPVLPPGNGRIGAGDPG